LARLLLFGCQNINNPLALFAASLVLRIRDCFVAALQDDAIAVEDSFAMANNLNDLA
jgi:hypothetical protein